MDINKLRIAALVDLIGDQKASKFALEHDIDASYISQIINGHRPMGDKAAKTLEQKIGLAPGTLVMPKQAATVIAESPAPYPPTAPAELLKVAIGQVPVVGKAKLGVDGYFEEMNYPPGHGDGFLLIGSTDPNAYGLQVEGNSMHPRIKHREYVVIEPNHPYISGDEVLVKTVSGSSMIKEFSYFRDGMYRFDSVNPSEKPIFLQPEEIELIHYVGGIVKSSRFVTTD